MAKETFYFSHDYNARNDIKIKRLIAKHGYAGYGIFWAVVEDLYNNDNCLPTDFETIAYDLRCSDDLVRSVVMDFDLFKIDGDEFGSSSIEGRLNKRSNNSNAGKATADARWNKTKSPKRTKAIRCIFYILKLYNDIEEFLKVGITTESISRRYSGKLEGYSYELLFSHDDDLDKCLRIEREISAKYLRYQPAVKFAGYLECLNMSDLQAITDFAMQGFEIRNAIKESKVKDRIEKESKVKEIIQESAPEKKIELTIVGKEPEETTVEIYPTFDDFWNLYDKKIDRPPCEKKWAKIPQREREKIMDHLPQYIATTPDKQYRKNPETFLNRQSWKNEITERNDITSSQRKPNLDYRNAENYR